MVSKLLEEKEGIVKILIVPASFLEKSRKHF
jgi:hypothetical protein